MFHFLMQMLRPLSVMTSGSNRLSVDVNNVAGAVSTVTTVTTVTTVGTVNTVGDQTKF